MSTLALILVLSSSVSHAVWNLLLKRSVDKEAFMFLSQIAISVLFAPISIFMFFRSPIGDIGWVFVVGTGILHVFYFVFLSRGYKYGELSEVYPVARGAGPALTPLLGYFVLGENVSIQALLGMLSVICGVGLVFWEGSFSKILRDPVNTFRRTDMKYALATGATIAMYSIWDKVGVSHVGGLLYVYLMCLGTTICLVPYMKYLSNTSIIKTEWSLNWKSAVGCGTLIYISYGLVLMALEEAKVSYVWPIRESGILVGLALGYFVLKEPIHKTSSIGCLMIVIGVVTIATAS